MSPEDRAQFAEALRDHPFLVSIRTTVAEMTAKHEAEAANHEARLRDFVANRGASSLGGEAIYTGGDPIFAAYKLALATSESMIETIATALRSEQKEHA